MADLTLNEDRKQYQSLARDFAQNEIAPHAHSFDISGSFPLDICKKAWEIGLLNVRMPESLGGLGLGVLDAVIIGEELAAACAGIATAVLGSELATAPLLVAGTDEQKRAYLEPLMAEFALAGTSLLPGDTGSHQALSYKSSGDSYIIDGETIALNAQHASWFFVPVREPEATCFAIAKSSPGLVIGERLPALGLKAADICTLRFGKVSVSKNQVVGKEGEGCALLRSVQAATDPIIAAYAVGVARCALQNATRYSQERQTMGTAIANHQAVGFMLADLAKDTEASRLLSQKAAWLYDAGQPDAVHAAAAKTFACEATMRGATDAVQVYGGYGYSREYPVEKLMRDAKMLQIYFGHSAQNKVEFGRQLVGAHK